MEPEWHGDFKLVMGLGSGGLTPVRNFTVAEKVWFHAIQYQKIQYHSTLRRWMSSEAVCVLLVKHKLLLTGIVSGLHCAHVWESQPTKIKITPIFVKLASLVNTSALLGRHLMSSNICQLV